MKFDDLFYEDQCKAKGSFGTVCVAKTKADYPGLPVDTVVAVKLIDKKKLDEEQLDLLENEVSVMRTVSAFKDNSCHKNIVCYYGTVNVIKNKKELFGIVMEYIDGQTLEDFIEDLMEMRINPDTNSVYPFYNISGTLNEQEIANLMKQLLLTLDYIHSLGVVHRDIKIGNIMLVDKKNEGEPIVKYIDFGFSCYNTINKVKHRCNLKGMGTPDYISPEIWEMVYNRIEGYPTNQNQIQKLIKSDIWALGIVFYELLFGSGPYSYTNNNQAISIAVMSDKPVPFPESSATPEGLKLKQVVELMLNKDYKTRPTAKQAYDFLISKFP